MVNLTEQDQNLFWHDHISAFIASGTTQKNYCKTNELNYSKFKQWRYKLTSEFPVNINHPRTRDKLLKQNISVQPNENQVNNNIFTVVKVVDDDPKVTTPTIVTLHLKRNIYLELPCDINISDLNKIFTALEII